MRNDFTALQVISIVRVMEIEKLLEVEAAKRACAPQAVDGDRAYDELNRLHAVINRERERAEAPLEYRDEAVVCWLAAEVVRLRAERGAEPACRAALVDLLSRFQSVQGEYTGGPDARLRLIGTKRTTHVQVSRATNEVIGELVDEASRLRVRAGEAVPA